MQNSITRDQSIHVTSEEEKEPHKHKPLCKLRVLSTLKVYKEQRFVRLSLNVPQEFLNNILKTVHRYLSKHQIIKYFFLYEKILPFRKYIL